MMIFFRSFLGNSGNTRIVLEHQYGYEVLLEKKSILHTHLEGYSSRLILTKIDLKYFFFNYYSNDYSFLSYVTSIIC
jgi:hypothetical protein